MKMKEIESCFYEARPYRCFLAACYGDPFHKKYKPINMNELVKRSQVEVAATGFEPVTQGL